MSKENTQEPTPYEPTKKERALLEVLANPEHRMKSVVEICKAAGCDRSVYYAAFRKPEFVALQKELAMEIVRQAVTPTLHACVREARKGSVQHQKIILGMADLYHDRKEISGPGGKPIEVDNRGESISSDIERGARLVAILDAARARATGQVATGDDASLGAAARPTDGSVK